MTTDFTDLLRH